MKFFLGMGSLLFALLLTWTAYRFFMTCMLPWRRAPETTHVTWIFAGAQFTGGQLYVPFLVILTLAVALGWFGITTLRNTDH